MCIKKQKKTKNKKTTSSTPTEHGFYLHVYNAGLVLVLRIANERRRYFVTTSLIGWVLA